MTNLHKNNSGSIVAIIAVLVAITVIGAAGYVVYSKNKSSKTSNTQAAAQQQQSTTPTSSEQATKPVNEDEQVTAAFYAYCDTKPKPEGYVKDYVIGTMGPDQKKFVYSDDKNFVALNGRCGTKDPNSNEAGHGGMAYILKKINGSWEVIAGTQQAVSDEVIAKYSIPSDFLKAIGLN